jgi:6,7-dimethyl-8-ribityllumazine synthase
VSRISTSKQEAAALDGHGKRFAVAVSRFNSVITESLLEACLRTLSRHGAAPPRVARAPGAFELPFIAKRLAASKKFHAVIVLGCIIRGETPHDRYISMEVARGIGQAALDTGVPVIFGVLTTLNAKQARARAGSGPKNKGAEAALAALEMANLTAAL